MPLPHVPADVKFDAVSGDYYPIIYFNDYWNLQKDYYPINESLATLPLRVSFCPLSLWRWQLYAAQSTKSPWNFLGDELYEQSDEEQDSVKVRWGWGGASQYPPGLQEGKGKWARPGDLRPVLPWPVSQPPRTPPRLQPRLTRGPDSGASVIVLSQPFCVLGQVPRVWPPALPCSIACFSPTVGSDRMSLLTGTVSLSTSRCPHLSRPASVTLRLHGACLGLSFMLGFCCLFTSLSPCLSPHCGVPVSHHLPLHHSASFHAHLSISGQRALSRQPQGPGL